MSGSHQSSGAFIRQSSGSHQAVIRQSSESQQADSCCLTGSLEANLRQSCVIHQTMDYKCSMELFSLKSQNLGFCRQIGLLNFGGIWHTYFRPNYQHYKKTFLLIHIYLWLGFKFGLQNLPLWVRSPCIKLSFWHSFRSFLK